MTPCERGPLGAGRAKAKAVQAPPQGAYGRVARSTEPPGPMDPPAPML